MAVPVRFIPRRLGRFLPSLTGKLVADMTALPTKLKEPLTECGKSAPELPARTPAATPAEAARARALLRQLKRDREAEKP